MVSQNVPPRAKGRGPSIQDAMRLPSESLLLLLSFIAISASSQVEAEDQQSLQQQQQQQQDQSKQNDASASDSGEDLEMAASSNEDAFADAVNAALHSDKHVSSEHEQKEAGHIIENRVQAPPQFHLGFPFNAHGLIHAPSNLIPQHAPQPRGVGHSQQFVNVQHHAPQPWPQEQQHLPPPGMHHHPQNGLPAPVFHPHPVPMAQQAHAPVFHPEEPVHHHNIEPQALPVHHQPEAQQIQEEPSNIHHHEEHHEEIHDNAVAPIPVNHQPAHIDPEEAWPLSQPDMPKIVHLDVKCEKNLMKVVVEFDRPFNGLIFSKGHYSYGSCVHLPAGSGKKSVFFDISINSCGTVGNAQNGLYGQEGNTATGSFFENTIIIQYDHQVQEVWDQARKLRCTWHNNYEKAVTFRPFPVDMLDVVRADFAGDNVGCWMQIQAGKGPWASEVAGIVKIGQTMTMVLAIKDDENKFDMLVRNCIAHDGQRAPIELVDSKGCVARPKLMSRFTKIKNFGSSATVLSYAHFQAFKFPDTMEVHFQCTIQICRYQCPEQCAPEDQHAAAGDRQITYTTTLSRQERDLGRFRRDIALEEGEKDIGVSKIIRVLSAGDVDFSLGNSTQDQSLEFTQEELSSMVCMSTLGFASILLLLLVVLVVTCIMCAFLYIRHKQSQAPVFKNYPHDLPVFTKKPAPKEAQQ
ncbi:uncharacterized protein LOC100908748 [Galendromus occidentalis]|uniref:Uncharacterized protein LOC100908748 n=1 Tax=Galendromus occidentalis TaxID=34638 RepID=A0AAJ6QXW2_9ACAR|nr:uncharacterized protein LOC100908748 [Galendromus occidentalis]